MVTSLFGSGSPLESITIPPGGHYKTVHYAEAATALLFETHAVQFPIKGGFKVVQGTQFPF